MNASTSAPPPAYVLEARADVWGDWRRVAGLVRHLTRRHLAARYRGSILGFFWSLLHPLLMMGIYTLVFQYIFRMSAPGVPYPVFFLTGLLAWNFVQTATLNGAISVVENHALIGQAYFPRAALPLSAVLSNLANYLISLPLLVLFSLAFGVEPGSGLLLLPLALVQLLLVATGLALLVSALTPFFGDTVQLLEVLFVGWFFATPVLYPVDLPLANLSPRAFALYELNPMVGVIGLVRWVFVGEVVPTSTLLTSALGSLAILVLGLVTFRRLSPRFATAG